MDGTSGQVSERLSALRDLKYRDFTASLIPNVEKERILGVRLPELRTLAKELRREGRAESFLTELPHRYLEEDLIHAFLLSEERDYDRLTAGLDGFLPFVDNWSVCDALRPRAFRKHPDGLPERIRGWLGSAHPYTVRFGIGMLMTFYLDDRFDPSYADWVAALRSEEYYVNMMIAWYFATALAKQYDAAVPYLEERRLDRWCHNKTIRKAVESFRVTPERKEYLRSLRLK